MSGPIKCIDKFVKFVRIFLNNFFIKLEMSFLASGLFINGKELRSGLSMLPTENESQRKHR